MGSSKKSPSLFKLRTRHFHAETPDASVANSHLRIAPIEDVGKTILNQFSVARLQFATNRDLYCPGIRQMFTSIPEQVEVVGWELVAHDGVTKAILLLR